MQALFTASNSRMRNRLGLRRHFMDLLGALIFQRLFNLQCIILVRRRYLKRLSLLVLIQSTLDDLSINFAFFSTAYIHLTGTNAVDNWDVIKLLYIAYAQSRAHLLHV